MGRFEVILLDTHIWVWWVHGDGALPPETRAAIEFRKPEGIAVSAISCWEVAKLVERGRLQLPMQIHDWMELAITAYGVSIVPLSPAIAIASTMLPGEFHRDPAGQIIVATSRVHDLPLVTCDQKIPSYAHVRQVEDSRIHDR